MKLKDKVAVVTGGATASARRLCERFAAEGARGVVVADLDAEAAAQLAKEIGGLAVATNVAVKRTSSTSFKKPIEAYGGDRSVLLKRRHRNTGRSG